MSVSRGVLTKETILLQTTLTDILPDILPALNSKNPQVKEGTLKFIARCLSTSPTPIPAPQIKPLSEALASLLEDSFEGARNEAAVCLGTLMKMVGERPLNALMDGLADVRKAKVKEAYDNAKVKAKAGSGPPKPAAPPASKEPPKKKVPPPKQPPTGELPAAPKDEEVLTPTENKPLKKPPARLMVRSLTIVIYSLCVHVRHRPRNLLLPVVGKAALHLHPQLQHRRNCHPPRPQQRNQPKVVLPLPLVHSIHSSTSTRLKMRRL